MKISKVIEKILDEADKFSSQGMWKDTKMFPITKKINVRNMRDGALVHFTGHKSGAKGETWKKTGQGLWQCIYGDGVKGWASTEDKLQKKLKHQGRIQINAGKVNEASMMSANDILKKMKDDNFQAFLRSHASKEDRDTMISGTEWKKKIKGRFDKKVLSKWLTKFAGLESAVPIVNKIFEGKLNELSRLSFRDAGIKNLHDLDLALQTAKEENIWWDQKDNQQALYFKNAKELKRFKKAYGLDEGNVNEGVPFPQDAPNEFAYLDYKKWAYKYRGQYKKDILKVKDSPGKIWATATKWWTEWAKRTGNKAFSNIKDSQKFGRELVKMMWKDNLIFDKSGHKITRLKEIRKGDYVNSMGEIGLVNKLKGQVAYVKFDSRPGTFHPILASSLKKAGKHKGRDLYTESKLTESTAQWEKTIKALAHKDALKKLKKGDKEKLLKIAQMLRKEKGLKESKRVTQNMWKKMSDDEKENALLTIFKDPDDRRFEDFLFSDWNKLPGWARRDMRTEGKLKENKSAMDIRDQVKMADKVAKKHGLTKAKKYRGVGFYWWLEIKDYPTSGLQDKLGMQILKKNKDIAMKQVQRCAKDMEQYLDDVEITDTSPSGVSGKIWLWAML